MPVYFSLPYFDDQCKKMIRELSSSLRFISQVNFYLILSISLKLSSFFRFKDRYPNGTSASVINEFCCALGSALVIYVGSTKRHLYERVAEHAGRSACSNKPLTCPHSAIRQHALDCP